MGSASFNFGANKTRRGRKKKGRKASGKKKSAGKGGAWTAYVSGKRKK